MERKKFARRCCICGAAVLQVVEFNHAAHTCAPGLEVIRCESLPGRHIHFPEPPAQGDMKLVGIEAASLSTGTLGSRVI